MNFKLPYPWIEPGRKCNTYYEVVNLEKDTPISYEKCEVEILNYDYEKDRDWCRCKRLDNNQEYYYIVKYLEPIYTIEEIMRYAEKTIIEEHWIDFNGDERGLYLLKFCGEYFRIDECWRSRKMEKVKV